jgi:uncharacterized protein (DUF1810 family)
MTDADLCHFVTAQTPIYALVVAELTNGCKQTHWIVPQISRVPLRNLTT